MQRISPVSFVLLVAGSLALGATAARADIPVGYKGMPFDPAVAGGPKIPATVKAGPYTIPGRLDFVNYDLGGDDISYHTGDHITKGGTGYRIDTPTATFSLTSSCIPNGGPPTCQNVWYDTSATLDGTVYPTPTTADFSIGAVQNGDWFDFTVNVQTAGTYALSSTWASGNGTPGGEGGDGSMGLSVFSNGTKLATWTATFPNYNTDGDFHHWKAYPSFAMVTLAAGPQVIKMQSGAKHLQMDYVQFDLVGADGGVTTPDAGSGAAGAGAAGAGGGTTGAAGTSGGAAGTGAAGDSTTGVAGSSGSTGAAGSSTGAAGTTTGSTGAAGTVSGSSSSKSGGCSVAAVAGGSGAAASFAAVFAMAFGALGRSRRRRRSR